jgi:predicted glycoside hydrolase/deacetylase ChbG (UPF0249 family)
MPTKRLIVNADDFGQSFVVRWPAAAEAANYSKGQPKLSVGLHVDFGEWAYRNESWVSLYEVVRTENVRTTADEVSRQLAEFRRLVGREPTHIDSHQHVHRHEPIRSVLVEVSKELGIPLREVSPEVRYRGDFYGQTENGEAFLDNISISALMKILADLPAGFTELGCHPAQQADLDTMYSAERLQELSVLCDDRIRQAIVKMEIELCSFHDVDARK